MSKKRDSKRKRLALPPETLSSEGKHLFDAINGASPLACVLISGAALDNALMSLLSKFFVRCDESKELLDIGGDLESFSKCVRMAFCLGLVDAETKHDLTGIARIRNLFAHSRAPLDFDDKDVRNACASIKASHLNYTSFKGATGRTKFGLAVITLHSRLLLAALSTTHREAAHPVKITPPKQV